MGRRVTTDLMRHALAALLIASPVAAQEAVQPELTYRVGEARTAGLMGGLELSPDPDSAATFDTPGKVAPYLSNELLKHGIILRAIGDTLAFCPPMIINEDEINALFEPLEISLDATATWAKAEGHLG